MAARRTGYFQIPIYIAFDAQYSTSRRNAEDNIPTLPDKTSLMLWIQERLQFKLPVGKTDNPFGLCEVAISWDDAEEVKKQKLINHTQVHPDLLPLITKEAAALSPEAPAAAPTPAPLPAQAD